MTGNGSMQIVHYKLKKRPTFHFTLKKSNFKVRSCHKFRKEYPNTYNRLPTKFRHAMTVMPFFHIKLTVSQIQTVIHVS